MSGRATILAITLFLAAACAGPWSGRRDANDDLVTAVEELASMIGELGRADTLAVVGFRDESGQQSAATHLLDEVLFSSLVRSRMTMAPVKAENSRWNSEEAIDAKIVRQAGGGIVVGGRLQDQGSWVYARLFAVDRDSGSILATRSRRLAGAPLLKLVEGRQEQSLVAGDGSSVTVELHVVGMRSPGGFEQQIPIESNGILEPTDRLQIRFDVENDCQVWAFLYSSKGDRRTLFENQTVYSGRDNFGPAEHDWLSAGESGVVYTMYFIAARRLEDETADLFDEMGKLIEQGEVERYVGFDKLDETLRMFFVDRGHGEDVQIVSAVPEELLTKPVEYLLENGTSVSTQGEKLGPELLIVRALRYEVL